MTTIDISLNTTADSLWPKDRNLRVFDFREIKFALKQNKRKKKQKYVFSKGNGDERSSQGSRQNISENASIISNCT